MKKPQYNACVDWSTSEFALAFANVRNPFEISQLSLAERILKSIINTF